MNTRITIVTGSVRPGRFNPQPAEWIYQLIKTTPDVDVQLVDLATINLPFLDEAASPATGNYTQEHTKKWSEIISASDGFIFVTPEYNHSYSPVLKNAIDFLYKEWNYKPVAFVSYGSLAGGSRAVEQLRLVLGGVKMYGIYEQVMLPSYYEHLNEKGQYQFTEQHEKTAKSMMDSLVFWTQSFKEARANLSEKK